MVARQGFLVAYTDGVTEARSSDRRLLGEDALEHALRHHAASKAQAVADACMDAALSHSNARLRDDALTLVLQRL
jgi:serine phosphatase RsbU (regulator of sigma subunit)